MVAETARSGEPVSVALAEPKREMPERDLRTLERGLLTP